MKTQIAKWGNSMAVRIPKAVAEAARLRQGDHLEVVAEGSGSVRIRKKNRKPKLEDLVRGISTENLHGETDWGGRTGGELW